MVMRELGHIPSDNELLDVVRRVDKGGNGTVAFPDLLPIIAHNMKAIEREEDLRKLFRLFDWMESIGRKIPDHEVDETIRGADQNGDGRIGCRCFGLIIEMHMQINFS